MEVPGQNTGFLMFTREEDWSQGGLDPSAGAGGGKVLVMNIGGDTYQSICTLLRGHKPIRPLSVDLLWSILERGHEISKREWSIRYGSLFPCCTNALAWNQELTCHIARILRCVTFNLSLL